jgi:diguanylate cyclase (GGDEF)-like protein
MFEIDSQPSGNREPFEAFMVRATAWLLGGIAILEMATWIILNWLGQINTIDFWLLPSLASIFVIMLGLLLHRPQRVKTIHGIMLAGICCYELLDLYSSGLPEVRNQNAIGVGMVWFPVTTVIAFLILRHQLAARLSTVYLLLSFVLGVLYFQNGINPTQINAMLQFYASNLAILGISWVFGHMRNQYLTMRTMAYTDSLTGLLNRRAMTDNLETAHTDNAPYCLLLIDIDEFKRVNDTFGHPVGDQVLREMALTLENHTRGSDKIARWGGEEFLILTTGSGMAQAQGLADRLLEAVRSANIAGLGLTVSIGLSERRAGSTLETIISMADVALYQAKNAGRNRTEIAREIAQD